MSNIGINCNLILDRNIELLQHPHDYCFLQHPHDYCFLQHPHGYCFFCSCRFLLSFVFILLLLWLFLLFVWLTCLLWVVIVGFLHKFHIPCQTPPWLRRYNLWRAFGESLHRDNALLVRTLGNQMSIRLSQTLIIVKSIKLVTVISGSLLVAESTLDPCNGYISLS